MLLLLFFFRERLMLYTHKRHRANERDSSDTKNQNRIWIVKSFCRMDFSQKSLLLGLVCQLIAAVSVSASAGDKSPYYRNCINSCLKQTCQNSELSKSEFNFLLPDDDFGMIVRSEWKDLTFVLKSILNWCPVLQFIFIAWLTLSSLNKIFISFRYTALQERNGGKHIRSSHWNVEKPELPDKRLREYYQVELQGWVQIWVRTRHEKSS